MTIIEKSLDAFRRNHTRHLRAMSILLVLSLIVIGVVFWQLRQDGITQANDASCGMEAHIHDSECGGLGVCQKLAHMHTIDCYAIPSDDVENKSDWDSMVEKLNISAQPQPLQVLYIAESQIGYTESETNYEVKDNGQRYGYTRYGDWYGDPYSDWSAKFVSFCLAYAGYNDSAYYAASIPAMQNAWEKNGLIMEETDGLYRGALVFVEGADGAIHLGFLHEVYNGNVTIIEGDLDGAVQYATYPMNKVVDFGHLPPSAVMSVGDDDELDGGFTVDDDAVQVVNLINELPTLDAVIAELDGYTNTIQEGNAADATEAQQAAADEAQTKKTNAIKAYLEAYTNAQKAYDDLAETSKAWVTNTKVLEDYAWLNLAGMQTATCQIHIEVGVENTEQLRDHLECDGTHIISLTKKNDAEEPSGFAINLESLEATDGVYTITVDGSKTLDLAGRWLRLNGCQFVVPEGASLTIRDSKATEPVVEDGTELSSPGEVTKSDNVDDYEETIDDNVGKVAEFKADTKTLTYYITDSKLIPDSPNGATEETLYKYTVTWEGAIIADQANANDHIRVTGGTFTLESGMIYTEVDDNSGRAINQTDGIVNLNGGYICNFSIALTKTTQDDGGGAIKTAGIKESYEGGYRVQKRPVLNLNGTVLAGNHATDQGGAIYAANGATVNINGGAISGNWVDNDFGGGIYIGGGTDLGKVSGQDAAGYDLFEGVVETVVNVNGGYITNNRVYTKNPTGDRTIYAGGGGISVGGRQDPNKDVYCVLNVYGGQITGNVAQGGGGILVGGRVNSETKRNKVYMYGGIVAHNVATGHEGGGISFQDQTYGYFYGGYINNNATLTEGDWGGGGIFNGLNSSVFVRDVLVTENSAYSYGGGVSGCSTARLYVYSTHGFAIFDNEALGNWRRGYGHKVADHDYADQNEIFQNSGSEMFASTKDQGLDRDGFEDIFCALNTAIDGKMLGGVSANWKGSIDGNRVEVNVDSVAESNSITGMTSYPSDTAKGVAQSNAMLYINGNYSGAHGGGIMCNGNLFGGESEIYSVGDRLAVYATKQLLDVNGDALPLEGGEYTFYLTDTNGTVMATGKNIKGGEIIFDNRLNFSKPGTYTYYLREAIPGDMEAGLIDGIVDGVVMDTTVYRIEINVEQNKVNKYTVRQVGTVELDLVEQVVYAIKSVTVSQKVDDEWVTLNHGEGYQYNGESEMDQASLTIGNKEAAFSNTHETTISIKVVKKWAGDENGAHPEKIQVQLWQGDTMYAYSAPEEGSTFELSAANNWSYTWTELPVCDEAGNPYEYKVVELTEDGKTFDPNEYEVSFEHTTTTSGSATNYFSQAISFEDGGKYVFVSEDGTKMLWISSDSENSNPFYTTEDEMKVTPPVEAIPHSAIPVDDTRWIFVPEEIPTDELARIPSEYGGNVTPYYLRWFHTNGDGAGGDVYLSVHSQEERFFKATTGYLDANANFYWPSAFVIDAQGNLLGRATDDAIDNGEWRNICFDEVGFNSISRDDVTEGTNTAHLYEAVTDETGEISYWVPATTITLGRKYIILDETARNMLYIPSGNEYKNSTPFDGKATYKLGNYTSLNLQVIPVTDDWNRGLFVAEDQSTDEKAGFWLKMDAVGADNKDVYLSVHKQGYTAEDEKNGGDNNFLKGTTGGGNTWRSWFVLEKDTGYLMGYMPDNDEGDEGYAVARYVVYDTQYQKFTTVTPEEMSADPSRYQYVTAYEYELTDTSSITTTVQTTITNTRKEGRKYNVQIIKVSENDDTLYLRDAKFELFKIEDGEDVPVYVTTENAATGSYTYADSSAEGAMKELITNEKGRFFINELPEGEYKLVETEAPLGYELMKQDEMFTLDKNRPSQNVEITCEDPVRVYGLPETGGFGVDGFVVVGASIIIGVFMLSILLWCKQRRRAD